MFDWHAIRAKIYDVRNPGTRSLDDDTDLSLDSMLRYLMHTFSYFHRYLMSNKVVHV
jgi:hypothetical protein